MEYPPKDLEKLPDWIRSYLSPQKNKRAPQAHQFTINGVTYPFVRDMHFAALPDPIKRRHSMYAGLFLTRPGDLLFFFQSDPQWRNDDINSRRGLRGIYRVISLPFTDPIPLTHPNTGYKIHGICPHCGTFHANLSSSCINPDCERDYPYFATPNGDYHELVLGCRLDIEPLIVFVRAVSDERAYADMSDVGMIWIGRHDNQMGRGKGSSVRQLLAEEAVKLTRMFLSEPEQKIIRPEKTKYPNKMNPILNDDGTPAEHLEMIRRPKAGNKFKFELSLNFHLSRTIDDPKAKINNPKALGKRIVVGDIGYVSSEIPWGYTAGESDFLLALKKDNVFYKILVMELKSDWIYDGAMIQASLYVPWVVQVLSQFAQPPPKNLEVLPITIGRRLAQDVATPEQYSYVAEFNSGVVVDVDVKSPLYIEYRPINIYQQGTKHYARDIEYEDMSHQLKSIKWVPPKGTVTSEIERNWVRNKSWSHARIASGLNP